MTKLIKSIKTKEATNEAEAPVIIKRERPVRAPISGKRDILTVRGKDDTNFVYRWVKQDIDRVADLQDRGYEFVKNSEIGSVGSRSIDSGTNVDSNVTKRDGSGGELVLMKQVRDWYEEDQKAKQREVDRTEHAIKNKGKEEGFYGGKFETDVDTRPR